MAQLSRRRLFGFLAAPAIVRASSLMPLSLMPWPEEAAAYRDVFIAAFEARSTILRVTTTVDGPLGQHFFLVRGSSAYAT